MSTCCRNNEFNNELNSLYREQSRLPPPLNTSLDPRPLELLEKCKGPRIQMMMCLASKLRKMRLFKNSDLKYDFLEIRY